MRLFDLFSEKRKREEKTEKKEGKGMASGTGNREETGNLPPRPFYSLGKGCYLAYEQKPNGLGGYRDVNVRLYEGERLVRALTDENGQFLDFPGIEHGSWEQHLTRPFEPVTRFAVSYNRFKEDGLAELVWMVQPDGRYWEDEDGFGGENDVEVELYAKFDENGQIVTPFRSRDKG